MRENLLELDGSLGEGGGQILRTSLTLSLLTGRPFHLKQIRAGRPRPGLQPQHLQSVLAAATIGNARVIGAELGSKSLFFYPGSIQSGSYRFDIGTAGATSLVLQTVYLPLALQGQGPSEITLIGGTHVSCSPSFHFLERTWRAYLQQMGIQLSLQMIRPGFYPRGGGMIRAQISPENQLKGVRLPERLPVEITGWSVVAGLPSAIASRQAKQAKKRLETLGLSLQMEEQEWKGGPATVLILEVNTQPAPTLFFSLGQRGKPAERVADEAVDEVLAYLQAGNGLVDSHSADQLVLPLALAEGPSEFSVSRVTPHLLTNIQVIQEFIDREISLTQEEPGPSIVRIKGEGPIIHR